MKATQPQADLPRSYTPFLNNAMPARSPKGGQVSRNLTGIYLGVEGSTKPPPEPRHKCVPPLARGRGMPSQRVKTPTENRRRRLVDTLRDFEERRGFTPQSIRKQRPLGVQYDEDEDRVQQQAVTFWDLTRQTPRRFTAATNAGVTHLEYLNADPTDAVGCGYYPDAFRASILDTLAREVHSASAYTSAQIGLVDCYNKICKGNPSTLHSLMPQRQVQTAPRPDNSSRYTGFTVKSYRNPNQAEISAQFPPPEARPRTVLGNCNVSRRSPHPPSPYFFKNYSPKAGGDRFRGPVAADLSGNSAPVRATPPPPSTPLHMQRAEQRLASQVQTETLPAAPQPTPSVRSAVDDTDTQPIAGGERTLEISLPTDSPEEGAQNQSKVDSASVQEEGTEAVPNTSNNNNDGHRVVLSGDHMTEESGESSTVNSGTVLERLGQGTGEQEPAQENNSAAAEDQTQAMTGESPVHQQNMKKEVKTPPTAASMEQRESSSLQSAAGHKLEKMPSGAEIMIGLEDESGTQKPVEIDETDEAIAREPESDSESLTPQTSGATTPKRRVSITERVLKQRNSEQQLQHLLEEKENRRRELAELLTEHAHLVHEVETLQEGSTDSADGDTSPGVDKENKTLPPDTGAASEQ